MLMGDIMLFLLGMMKWCEFSVNIGGVYPRFFQDKLGTEVTKCWILSHNIFLNTFGETERSKKQRDGICLNPTNYTRFSQHALRRMRCQSDYISNNWVQKALLGLWCVSMVYWGSCFISLSNSFPWDVVGPLRTNGGVYLHKDTEAICKWAAWFRCQIRIWFSLDFLHLCSSLWIWDGSTFRGPPVVVPPAQFPAASAFAPSLGTPVSGSAWDGSPVGNGEIP